MIKNYLKIAWRTILGSKVYSSLNILGLAAGMAVALLIGLWVFDQYSYDKFLPGYKQLYQIKRNYSNNGEINTITSSSLGLADKLRSDIPEIESVAETDYFGGHGLMVGSRKLYLYGPQAAGNFLDLFQFPMVQGDPSMALKDPFSIVLTESTAEALFGREEALGKTVRVDDLHDLKVTGIVKNLPSNSTFNFAYLIPFSYYESVNQFVKADRAGGFNNNSYQLFVKLKPGVGYEQVEPKIRYIEKKYNKAANSIVDLQPLQDWHLYTTYKNGKAVGGFIEYVQIFTIIGILVLTIACINFINLTTARSEKRSREVGVRKAIGSRRRDLIFQFLTESVLITLIAFFFSVLFVQLAIPSFNLLTGNVVSIPYSNGIFWLIMFACVLMTALLAGSRPAFYLSSFNAVKVLKGRASGKSATVSRKIMVVAQFSCSIALIISTIIIYRQINHAKSRPTGYNLSQLMQTDLNEDLENHMTALKNELIKSGLVKDVAAATSPADGIYWHSGVQWEGELPGENLSIGTIKVTENYFRALGMELTEGKDFTGSAGIDSTNIIVNEAAVQRLRLKIPIGQLVTWSNRKLRIIGVAKNALMESPYRAAEPVIFIPGPVTSNKYNFLFYKLLPQSDMQGAIAKLKAIFNRFNPAYPFAYIFMDQSYANKFNLEVLIGKLAGIFAGLAIFISCLGLFGLAAYVAEQRAKEISVRKVLGASISQLWILLSKDFMSLVLISCLIASPVSYYLLQKWLLNYNYRVSIGISVFIIAAFSALALTLLTISFQAIKAAIANPVKSLRSE